MKKNLLVGLLILLISCTRNSDIHTVITSDKLIKEIDEFIADSNEKKTAKFITVSGIVEPEKKKVELLLANNQPVFIKENSPRINKEIQSKKYGHFTYKGYEFLVDEKLKNTFNLKYEDFDHMKQHFLIQEEFSKKEDVVNKKWRAMHIQYNTAKDSVEFSTISELSIPDSPY
ncbi:hypothetical protein EG347_00150 [Chryseobacterium sp. G0186]|uniref:hypothetical protein n=1 Tax=Chryseobacterium sp. G0186 TaxID=2487064 RepID=UPI000F4F94E9|nr:hypothetical protein [Chryseobacterium sp. G0186]AZA76049.1 hypothetical protein EG347_00150 [Chryseobacterium sp. G0186]